MAAKHGFSRIFRRAPATRLRKTGIALLLLVVVCASGIWFLGRESTLIFAANQLSERLGGRLQTVDVRGSLLRTIRVHELRYEDKFGALVIEDAHLEWRPIRLLLGQVAVGAMAASKVTLQLAKSGGDEQRKPP
ncbi:MAG TPA: hypothetical protein VLN59_08110, partial [Burkholderiales bacterium]|nr:hypothetical protein [Burkholderiales bacterium]